MNKTLITLIALFLFIPTVFAGPPPDAGGGVPVAQSVKKTAGWIGLEYGWYAPSLKTLNRTFSGNLSEEKIGINDYISFGIGIPVSGDDRMGLFFGYWNGIAKQSGNKLNLNMVGLAPEAAFRIVKIKDIVRFSLGFIARDVFAWWKYSGEGSDSSGISLITDLGGKITTEYYPIPKLSIKLDFGRIFWGFMWDALLEIESEEKVKIETHGNILKLGLNLYY